MTDDPKDLAAMVASLPKPLLLASDVDGTLSELTDEPDAARLVPGAVEALTELRDRGCEVAIVSGRAMCDLVVQFGLPSWLHLVGSHGAERGADPDGSVRTAHESYVLEIVIDQLEHVASAHEGAWVESKPFGAALHVRRCTHEVGERALLAARSALGDLDDVRLFDGQAVVEATIRNTSKRLAMAELREHLQPTTIVFLGDDANDEAVFESLTATDLGVKVGPGVTLATHRLAVPHDTVEFLAALTIMI